MDSKKVNDVEGDESEEVEVEGEAKEELKAWLLKRL